MTTTTPETPIAIYDQEHQCICYDDVKYPLERIAIIIRRDKKLQARKRATYEKWRKTEKGRASSQRCSKVQYAKKKLMREQQENIDPEN